jgi:hypothetical protein
MVAMFNDAIGQPPAAPLDPMHPARAGLRTFSA